MNNVLLAAKQNRLQKRIEDPRDLGIFGFILLINEILMIQNRLNSFNR